MSRATIEFILDEEVTPELFAQKVALACAYRGAIKEGEAVRVDYSGAVTMNGGRYPNHFVFWCWQTIDLYNDGKMIVTVPDIESKVIINV